MQLKLDELSPTMTYFAMTQVVMPRPIAWILSENENASFNLAPFSFFNAVCSDPALIMVSFVGKEDGIEKDTLRNIRERSEFVIHIAGCDQLPEVNQTSAPLAPGESEVAANDLAITEVPGFHLPRLRDCKIAMMCERYDIQEIGNNKQQLLFGEIKEMYLDDDCVQINDKGRLKILADKIKPLARLGAGEYAAFGDILQATRPT